MATDTCAETAAHTKGDNDKTSTAEEVETRKGLENKKVEINNNPEGGSELASSIMEENNTSSAEEESQAEEEEPSKVLDKYDDVCNENVVIMDYSMASTTNIQQGTEDMFFVPEGMTTDDMLVAVEPCDDDDDDDDKEYEETTAPMGIQTLITNTNNAQAVIKAADEKAITQFEAQEQGSMDGNAVTSEVTPKMFKHDQPQNNLNAAQEEFIQGSDVQQPITFFTNQLISNKTSHSQNTNPLQQKKRDNDENTLPPEEVEIGLDKLATEENKKVETNHPQEGCDGTAEGEKMTELSSTDKAIIEENNSSAEDIGKPSKTENEMKEKKLLPEGENKEDQDFGIILNRGIPPYESQEEAEESSKVLDKDDDGGMTLEETSVQDQAVLKGESEDKTSHSENTNDGTTLQENQLHEEMATMTDIAEGMSENKRENDEMVPVKPEELLDKLAPEETNMVEIDNSHESLKNNENCNDGTVEVETVLQVDINTNDNYGSHQSKILENDTMVDGSVPQENPEEELSEMITEHVKQVSVEAPSRVHTDDNEIVAVCEGISEVKQQCTAEMSKDDADSKKFTCENEAEKILKAAEEELIEGSDIQQNIEPITFSKELISNKSDKGLLKGESEEKTSHSENTNVGTALQERKRDNDEKTLPEVVEIGLEKLATEENKKDEINHPQEGCDGTAEGETMTELASTDNVIIEENNSSAEDIGKPSKTENEMQEKLFPEGGNREDQDIGIILNRGVPPYESPEEAEEPSKVLHKDDDGGMSPEETSVQGDLLEKLNEDNESGDVCNKNDRTQNVTIAETRRDEGVLKGESEDKTSHSENTNDGTTLQEKKRGNDEMVPVEPDVMLDKQAAEETNMVEIDNPHESLTKNEDGNDGTVEVEKTVELPSVAKAIEEPKCSAEPIENPTNTEDEMLSVEPEVVLDKQTPEETNMVEINNPHESMKNNEDGGDGTVAKAIEEPDSSAEPTERPINTEDEMLPVEPEVVLDKQAPEVTDTVEIDNPHESLKNNEEDNDETVEVENAIELPSVAKVIEEPNSSAEHIEKPINTEDEMLPAEPEVMLDKQTPLETNMVEIDNPHESLKNNEDGNDGTVEVEKVVELPAVAEAIEEPNCSAEPIEKPINTEDEIKPAEPEVVLDKPPPEETNKVEIDNPHEHNENSNDGTVEVEKQIELPSVVKVIEVPNSSAEHIEKPINTEDEMLPVEPKVVLDKLAPEETNMVVIEDPPESLTNNEDGNDGTVLQVDINTKDNDDNHQSKILEKDTMVGGSVPQENPKEELTEHVKQVSVEAPRRKYTDDNEIVAVCEGISQVKQQCTAEMSKDDADSKNFTCENEAEISLNVVHEEMERSGLQQNTELTFSRELIFDKIDDVILKGESGDKFSHSENINDGIDLHEKQLREEMATIADIAKGTSESKRENDDKTLPVEPEVVLNKIIPEEKTVEIDNPHEFLICNEGGSYETVEGENVIELPSVSNANVEEHNGSQEAIEKPSKTGDEMPKKLLSEGENKDGQDMGIIMHRGVPLNETQQEAEEPSNVLDKVDDEGMTPKENSVEADAVINSAADLIENLKDGEESGEACEEKEKLFIPEGKNMDSMVVESSDDKEYGRVEKEECFAETSKIAPTGIQSLCSDSKNFQAGTGSPLSTSVTEETNSVKAESVKASFDKIEGEIVKQALSQDNKRDQICTQIEHNDTEIENVRRVDDLLGSELVASEITETTLDEAAPKSPEPADSAPPRADLQGKINTNDNSNHSKILEQDTTVDGNLSTACEAQQNPKEKLSDLITEHEGNLPKESEEPVSTEASGKLHTDDNETTAVREVISQMKQHHGTVEMSEDDADSKNSICQNGAEKNLNSAQEDIERSCLQQNTEPTTFSKEELISEQSNEGILEGESEDKASHSQNTDEGITLQEKQLHEEVATIADIAEGTSETKRESDEKTLPDENEVMLDKLAPDESKKVEIGNPHEISKSNEEGSVGTVEGEKMIELTSVAKDTIEENNRCTEPIENPSKTEDELPEKLFSEGENGEGQDTGNILNRVIPPNESQPEADEPSKVLEKDDDEGMTPEKPFVHTDAVIICPADSTKNLIEDGEKSGEVCNENDSTQSILATKTSFPNDDSNETNIQGIEDKEKDKDFIPEGENTENMDSSVVESHDDKDDGKENKEESLAEPCKVPLMEIQSQSSASRNAHIVIGSPLSTSPTEETGSERGRSSEVEPESIKVSSDEIVKQEIFSHGSSSCQISNQMEHNIEHDELETKTIQGVNDLLGSQLVSPEIKETGLGEGTTVSEKTADPAPLIQVHGTVLEGGVDMNENEEDHQCKIIEKDNIVDDSVTEQEENITRASEDQASKDESRGLHRDENDIVAAHDVISEVEQQDTVDSKDSLFKYEPEKQNLHAPCEETEKAALPQNADQTAFNEELISVKDEVLKGESEDKAAHSDNNGKTNPQETNMLTVDLDEAKSIEHNENSACANYSTVDENPEEQFDTATDVPTQELKHAYEANKMPEIKVLGDTYVEGQSDLDLISACPADIHVAEDNGENRNAMCLEEVADMENQEDQIKRNESQRATSEVRGNLSKEIENEISKYCICSYNIINKEESCSTKTGDARGNEEDAKESKEVVNKPVTEAIYNNFQTTHADIEEQVASLLGEENPITEIGNETTIAETSSPLRTREGTVTNEILLEEEHSGINSEGRSLNDLEEDKLELNQNSLEHRTEEFMINSSDSSTKVYRESVQPDEELIPSSQSVAEEGDESIISDDALTSSAEDTCPQRVTNTSSKPESIVLEKAQVGSINEEIKKECKTAEDSKMEPQECIFGENTFYTQSVESEKITEVGAAETSKNEDNKMFQDKLMPENTNVEPKSVDTFYSTDKEIQGAGMEETYTEPSELDSEKSDHVIEYAPEVHKLELPLEAEQNGLVEENLAEREIEEIVIKKTNEENDIIKADISSEETQIADQSANVKSSMDCPEEVLSLGAYQEDEQPEENELEKLGEDESIKEEASSDDKAGAESSAAQDSKANILHAIETEVAEESHDRNGKEISEMPILQEHMKHSLADEKQNEELQSIVDGADTAKTLDDEKVYSCTELQEGITGEADRSQRTESSTPTVSECVQLMQKEPVLTAVKPEIQELETEKVSGAPSETEMNQTKTNEMPTNTSKETPHEHGHDEIQSDIIANSQVLARVRDSDITEEDECSEAVSTEALRTEKNQCTKPALQKENSIKSLTQGPGETTMEIAIEQFLKPKTSEDDEAENVGQIKRMQEEDETKNMETVNLKDIVQSMQEKETVVLSAPREDGEDPNAGTDENISTDNINASQLPQDKSAETCQFEAEEIKENAKEASTHIRIEALEQLRTTKAEAVFEGSAYKEENIISDRCRKTMETAEMDQTVNVRSEDPVQVTQKKHKEETFPVPASEGKVVLDTHEDSTVKTHQALDEPIAIEDFVYISQNKHKEETKPNENAYGSTSNANENVQQATSQNISSSEILKAGDETVVSDDSAKLKRDMHEEVAISKSHQPPIASENALEVPQLGTGESHQTRDETIESGSKEARDETSIAFDKEEEHDYEEARSDEEEEENEGGEHKGEESGPEAPVIVENATARDGDVKAAGKKKHHNILSGVGSKVKHSIARVKKVITGKSSPPKQNSPKVK